MKETPFVQVAEHLFQMKETPFVQVAEHLFQMMVNMNVLIAMKGFMWMILIQNVHIVMLPLKEKTIFKLTVGKY